MTFFWLHGLTDITLPKLFHFLPAPKWVLIISIPFVYAFNFLEPHSIGFLNRSYDVGPQLLINIPDNILDAITFPNFSKINTLPFWTSVMSITIIAPFWRRYAASVKQRGVSVPNNLTAIFIQAINDGTDTLTQEVKAAYLSQSEYMSSSHPVHPALIQYKLNRFFRLP